MTLHGYSARKAAQVTAFFAIKEGGSINVLKLAKLLYLSDREHLSRYDFPILFDTFVSMPHGPVTSLTLNYVKGFVEDAGWNEFITDLAGYCVGVAVEGLSLDDLDELSNAEADTLEDVWTRFGKMDRYAIRDWTHDNCDEWEDPHGSSTPIPYVRVLKFLKRRNPAATEEEIENMRSLNRIPKR